MACSSDNRASAEASDGGGGASGAPGTDGPLSLGPASSAALAGLEAGNGFDDLRYSSRLGDLIVPGNYSGNIYLVDVNALDVTTIGGFSQEPIWNGSDTQGPATVDEGGGYIFVGDRTSKTLSVVDPGTQSIVAQTMLAGYPDYVRYVETTSELWVTEPFEGAVEILAVPTSGSPMPTQVALIQPGGVPEGLGVDATRGLVFSQSLFGGDLFVMDARQRALTSTWPTGCTATHGNAAVDEERGFVFVGCLDEARVSVLDIDQNGATVGTYDLGLGAFLPAYSAQLHHLYLRGDPGLPIAVLGVGSNGTLELLGQVDSVEKAHCLAADDQRHFWTCDWLAGTLLRFDDPFAATP